LHIKVKKLSENAHLPRYIHLGDAGADLASAQNVKILPDQTVVVMTDLAFELPEGIELQVRSRSGMAAKHGVFVLNAPGTIDSGFKGNVGVILTNLGGRVFEIKIGDRIAQAVFSRYEHVSLQEGELSDSERGDKGWGSSGVK
jgi:dUTP pyrophosphatase